MIVGEIVMSDCHEHDGVPRQELLAARDVFHTSSTHGCGDELVDTHYMLLDMTPKGRNENDPDHNLMNWVRCHDEYESERPSGERT